MTAPNAATPPFPDTCKESGKTVIVFAYRLPSASPILSVDVGHPILRILLHKYTIVTTTVHREEKLNAPVSLCQNIVSLSVSDLVHFVQ